MIHLGDITKISGYEIPSADCVTFGAPCQDTSLAGKRKGMKHTDKGDEETTRSGLFYEAIRVIKEMRDKDEKHGRTGELIRPRFAVYENPPGAFSSNKGEDFRCVLESLAKIVDEDAVIPMPEKGKWTTSGCIMADGWSIAWRVLEAQFYGVPQRRRRIALIADFGGECASEILFVRKGLQRDFEESGKTRKRASENAEGCVGADDSERGIPCTLKIRSGCEGGGKGALIKMDKSATLSTHNDQTLFQPIDKKSYGFPLGFRPENVRCYDEKATTLCVGTRAGFCNGVISIENHPADSRVNIDESGKVQTLTSRMETGGGNVPMVMEVTGFDGYNHVLTGDKGNTLTCAASDSHHIPFGDACHTLGTDSRNYVVYKNPQYIVRRLTPLECERLQGFPDGWTDIGEYIDSNGKKKQTSDSARYKALGNSIALPPWKWVLKRLCSHYERDATLLSLFDGIGGFPLIWEGLNGKGTCLFASEIEEFPIAVTKARIG